MTVKYLGTTGNGTQYRAVGVEQIQAVTAANPAVEQERLALEQRSLGALRRWALMNPVERAMSFELERAVRDLLFFEGRHGVHSLK